jgi:hypothetical protein
LALIGWHVSLQLEGQVRVVWLVSERERQVLGLHAAALPPPRGHAHRLRPRLPALAARVGGALIDREERKGKGASDHAPVVVELSG